MRVNWLVPVRALASVVLRIAKLIWTLVEIIISIPLVPLMYLLVLMGSGFQVICRKIRRLRMVADFVLIDPAIDEYGHVWATVEGKPGVDGLIAGKHKKLKLVNEGLVMEIETEEGTYLATYLEPDQDYKAIAKVMADIFITQDINKIKLADI